jgi:hypothetical protein
MTATSEDISGWLPGRLPKDWYAEVTTTVDRDEIVVIGALADTEGVTDTAGAEGRITRFREQTRGERIRIAQEAEARFGRTIAWGATVGDITQLFTSLSVPVMTRLRQPERVVLDTLVDAGVARSRSHALAWCVRLVGQHSEDWLAELRSAIDQVQEVPERGPAPYQGRVEHAPVAGQPGNRTLVILFTSGGVPGSELTCGTGAAD